MKNSLTFILLFTGFITKAAIVDTTIVEFDDKNKKSKIRVISGDKQIEIPKILNLNNVLKAIGLDSNDREKAIVYTDKKTGESDTLIMLSKDGQRIKIITNPIFRDTTGNNSGVDSTVVDGETIGIERNGEYSKPEKEDEEIENAPKSYTSENRFFKRSDFAIYYGLVGMSNSDIDGQETNLRRMNSNLWAISFRKNITLHKGENADVAFSYSPEFVWYRYRLQNLNVVRYNESTNVTSFESNSNNVKKSKFVVPFINLPIMINLGFKEEKFKIGFGGSVGYRTGGYTKENFVKGGKEKIQSSFGLNDVIYGLCTEMGRKNRWTIFFRADLNRLFKEGQEKLNKIRAYSFGLRF
ncbi:MAG: hypothetical protein ACRCVT_01450 [Leadbetterella sp.]